MKKTILTIAVITLFAFASCKSDKKETVKETKTEVAAKVYQCPMDCEKGKTYDKAGSCPVCKMDLKPIK